MRRRTLPSQPTESSSSKSTEKACSASSSGYRDIGEAVDRARSLGQDVREVSAFNMNPLWRTRFDKMDEALLGTPVHGVRVAFSQIEPTHPDPD